VAQTDTATQKKKMASWNHNWAKSSDVPAAQETLVSQMHANSPETEATCGEFHIVFQELQPKQKYIVKSNGKHAHSPAFDGVAAPSRENRTSLGKLRVYLWQVLPV
jgi:hypothetical protein